MLRFWNCPIYPRYLKHSSRPARTRNQPKADKLTLSMQETLRDNRQSNQQGTTYAEA